MNATATIAPTWRSTSRDTNINATTKQIASALDDAQEDRHVDHRDAAVDQPQFPDMAVMLGPGRARVDFLEAARAVDDAREAADHDVEDRADAREQEHRRDRAWIVSATVER